MATPPSPAVALPELTTLVPPRSPCSWSVPRVLGGSDGRREFRRGTTGRRGIPTPSPRPAPARGARRSVYERTTAGSDHPVTRSCRSPERAERGEPGGQVVDPLGRGAAVRQGDAPFGPPQGVAEGGAQVPGHDAAEV